MIDFIKNQHVLRQLVSSGDDMFENVHFVRAMGIAGLVGNLHKTYGVRPEELGIPAKALEFPMTLIPVSVLNQFYENIELITGDQDAVLNLVSQMSIDRLGSMSRWFFSGHDLASTIRRINFGITCIQSGAFLSGEVVGPIVKWTYYNSSISAAAKADDGVRVANFMCNVLKRYLGEEFVPDRVCISGTKANRIKYEAYFGCPIEWGHNQTEVWLPNKLRLQGNKIPSLAAEKLSMSFADLDNYLNMPDSQDHMKVLYEVVNYSRHFGIPTLAKVSELLGLSEQQLQRRLQASGLNFTSVVGFVLSGEAVKQIVLGTPMEQIAESLGYTNMTSFSRMFKKYRGITPKQYLNNYLSAY
ncbi:Helix-turn-helix domain protein [Vibrio mediterranei]|uniref:AraC family transcriptional regulator n=2 Tax=Vibrio mediterranei TaxID=689 RepID=A0ABX5DGK2_9VIBR|nr:AraC family transcriptional regulator [Vibrio mediterranei]PRQ68779.1 AraC family transcriptional regulator [Vibrio mediterranei]PTC06810.1 AraC family transcriptional regulator [Vibrio mediterranei]SBO08584.1 Helix-turn-helix domain protein [Vibrio mediterranei]